MKRTCRLLSKLDPRLCKVYLVTDDLFQDGLVERVKGCIDGGVKCVQVRLKHSDTKTYLNVVRDVIAYGRPRGVKVIVDDRADVCMAADADGLHVGGDDMPAEDARKLIGQDKILGVTVYGCPERMLAAIQAGADYVGTGAMFPTTTKATAPVSGLQSLAALRAVLQDYQLQHPNTALPVIAIGGIKPENAGQCLAAGADGVAMVSGLLDTEGPYAAACKARTVKAFGLLARSS